MSSIHTTDVAIVGGGTAGITVAARLKRAGVTHITIVDPAEVHYYQPLWTLVGAGEAKLGATARPMAKVVPTGVRWLTEAVVDVDPDESTLSLASGSTLHYQWLIMAPGIQLDVNKVEGLANTLGTNGVTSNYRADLAPYTWDLVRSTTSGTAVFTMPAGPIKCAGAPQKATYMSADWWRRQGVLDRIDIHMILPTPGLFGIESFANTLAGVVERYGINVHFNSQLVGINSDTKTASIRNDATGDTTDLPFDVAHVVPPQSAPDWVKATPLADPNNPGGYIEVDKHTLRHTRFANVFALGDAGNTPNSKTGAAIRKQAPVVVANLMAARRGTAPRESYDGYASCPLVTARGKCVIAEFDYDLKPKPSFPVINMAAERTDMYALKKYGLPALYWHGMLKGLV